MGAEALQTVIDALGGSAVERSGTADLAPNRDTVAEALRLAEQHNEACQQTVIESRDGVDECKTTEETEAAAAARAPGISMAEDRAEAARVLLRDVQGVASAVQQSSDAEKRVAAAAAAEAEANARAIADARLEEQEQALEASLEARDRLEVARIINELCGAERESALQALKHRKVPVAKLVKDIDKLSPMQRGQLRASIQRAAARAEAQALARAEAQARARTQKQGHAHAPESSGPHLIPEEQAIFMRWDPAQSQDADPKWNEECALAEKGPSAQGAWKAHANGSRDIITAAALAAMVTSCRAVREGLKLCARAPERIASGLATFHPAQQEAIQAELRGGKHFVTVISGTGTPYTSVAVRLTAVQAPCSAVTLKVQVSGAKTAEVDVLQLASLMCQAGAHVGVQQVQQVLGGRFTQATPIQMVAGMHATAMAAIQAAASYQAGQRLRTSAPAQSAAQEASFEVQMRLDEAEKLPSRIQVVTPQGVAVLLQMSGPGVEACDQCGRRGHQGARCKHGQSKLTPFRIQYWGSMTKGKIGASARRPAAAQTRKARGRGRTHQAGTPQTAAGQLGGLSPASPPLPPSASAPPSTRADSADDGGWQIPRSQTLKDNRAKKKALAADQRRQEAAADARVRSLSRVGRGAHRSTSRRRETAPQAQATRSPQSKSSRDAVAPGPQSTRNMSPTETDPPLDCAAHMGIGPPHLKHAGAQELEPGEISAAAAAADCTVALDSQGVQELESC